MHLNYSRQFMLAVRSASICFPDSHVGVTCPISELELFERCVTREDGSIETGSSSPQQSAFFNLLVYILLAYILLVYILLAYILLVYILLIYMLLVHILLVYILLVYILLVYILLVYILLVYILLVHILLVYILLVYLLLVYILLVYILLVYMFTLIVTYYDTYHTSTLKYDKHCIMVYIIIQYIG